MRRFGLALCSATLAACGNAPGSSSSQPAEYKISEDGSAYVNNVTRYESLGEKSLTRGQKYKIVRLGAPDVGPHFLVANITQYYGNKKGDVGEGTLIFIKDGSASYDCSKIIFDLKLSQSDDDVPNVTCKFEVVGVVPLASGAVLRASS
jgi:hypothetical protein